MLRQDHRLATLRRTGWYWRRHRADDASRYRVRLETPAPGDDDLLALAIAATSGAPPGRPGWWAHLLAELGSLP